MFLVGELGATINADRSPFDRTLNGVFRDGARQMQRLGTRLTAALSLPLAGAGALAVKTAADYERLQTSMAVLNGSVEEGTRQFERLQEFSARTPFQLQDLAQAQNMLQGFGLSADEAFESLSMIGDIAAVSGGSIEGIGIAFGQAAAEGRLMTRDIRQLINQGVPAIKLLADSMGVASDEIFDLAEAGEISFQDLQKAFQDATTEGGMFANGMQKQSQTIAGLFSTLRDNVSRALSEIGNSIVDTFDLKGTMRDLISQIQLGIDWFGNLSEETRRMAFYMAGLLGVSGPIIAALGTLGLALSGITAPIAAAVAAVAGGAALLISNWEEVETYFTTGGGAQMWSDLEGIIQNSTRLIKEIWDDFGDDIMEGMRVAWGAVKEIVETSLGFINDTVKVWADIFTGNIDEALNTAEQSFADTFGSIQNIIDSVLTFGSRNDPFSRWIFETMGLVSSESERAEKDFLASLDAAAQGLIDARMKMRAHAIRPDDVIIPEDIDFGNIGVSGDPMGIFEGASNPIEQADAAAKNFGTTLTENVSQGLQNMRAATDPALQGLSLLQIGAMNVGNELTEAERIGQAFALTIGDAFSQAALHGQDLLDSLKAIVKQFASRALVTALRFLLPGGPVIGKTGFFGTMFGGFRANGGSVFAGQGYRVGETGQPEMFIPSTNGSVQPISGGGSSISQRSMQMAFEKALGNYVKGVSDRKIFEMAEKGRFG